MKRQWDTFLRNLQGYYGLHLSQLIGFLIVLAVFISVKVVISMDEPVVYHQEQARLLAWLDSVETLEDEPKYQFKKSIFDTTAQLFSFNPNQVSVSQMTELGMPKWLAERIEKFRAKNGVFRKKEDLAKIYGFPEALYSRLEPYIQLPEKRVPASSSASKELSAGQIPPKFELNIADTTQLIAIRGIASKRAAAIVAYRERLGGFYDYWQVSEIYSLKNSPDVVENLKAKTTLNPALIKKIAINSADTSILRPHPYLGYKRANALVLYRKNNGKFNSMDDLKKIYVLDSATLRKLEPYISFD